MTIQLPKPEEFLMPKTTEDAVSQWTIEALRQITSNLQLLHSDMTEDRKLLTDVRDRVIRIESNRLDTTVGNLVKRVEDLETDRHRRDGAIGLGSSILKSPLVLWMVALAAAVIAFLKVDNRI